MSEPIDDLYISTQGEGPTIDSALALAKTALQAVALVPLNARVAALEAAPSLELDPEIMLYGGDSGVPVELPTTEDGRELLTLTREQQTALFTGTIGVFGSRFVYPPGDGVVLQAANGEDLIALNGEQLITRA